MRNLWILLIFGMIITSFAQNKEQRIYLDIDYKTTFEEKGLLYQKKDTSLVTGRLIKYSRKGKRKSYIIVNKGKPDHSGWINFFEGHKPTDQAIPLFSIAAAALGYNEGFGNYPEGSDEFINSNHAPIVKDEDDDNRESEDRSIEKLESKKESMVEIKNGLKELFYPDGSIMSKVEYKNGVEHGEWKVYHDNGQIKMNGFFNNGMLDGVQERFDEHGDLEYSETWKDGELVNDGIKKEFYESGLLKMKESWKDGKKDGLWERYYEDGRLWYTESWKDGMKNGSWEWYAFKGLFKRETYKNDELIKTEEF